MREGLRRLSPGLLDVGLAVTVLGSTLIWIAAQSPFTGGGLAGFDVFAAVLVVAASFPLVWRRRAPLAVLLIIAGAAGGVRVHGLPRRARRAAHRSRLLRLGSGRAKAGHRCGSFRHDRRHAGDRPECPRGDLGLPVEGLVGVGTLAGVADPARQGRCQPSAVDGARPRRGRTRRGRGRTLTNLTVSSTTWSPMRWGSWSSKRGRGGVC